MNEMPKIDGCSASANGGGPTFDSAQADSSAGASAGGTQVSASTMENGRSKIRGRIVKAKRYTSDARARQEKCVVRISITIAPTGVVTAVKLGQSSGSTVLDT